VDADACTLRVSGELDPESAPTLVQAAAGMCRPMTVDLSATTFIDAGGLGALVRIQPSRLANVSARLRRVFEAGGLTSMLPPLAV
jgi:anti-anti-sigma factor